MAMAARPLAEQGRALKQVDPSIRQENAKTKIIASLRRGAMPNEADNALGTFGKGNFEKSADLHSANNLMMNMRAQAKPTDNGARGAVAARIHSKLAKNYDGDTEDGVNFIQQAAQRSVRQTMLRAAREEGK